MWRRRLVEVDRLELREKVRGRLALLTRERRGLFHAAERNLRLSPRRLSVDVHDAGLNVLGETQPFGDIARKD